MKRLLLSFLIALPLGCINGKLSPAAAVAIDSLDDSVCELVAAVVSGVPVGTMCRAAVPVLDNILRSPEVVALVATEDPKKKKAVRPTYLPLHYEGKTPGHLTALIAAEVQRQLDAKKDGGL